MITTDSPLAMLFDDLAGSLMSLDVKDLPELARLHTVCESIAAHRREQRDANGEQSARRFAEQIESIIRSEDPQPAATIEAIGQTLASLQRGASPSAASIPATAAIPAAAPKILPAAAQEIDPSLIGDFILEAREHIEAANVSLLTLETEPGDENAINAVFRAFHTIKGVAGFLALGEIQSLAHEAENLLDQARKGRIALTGPAIDAIFDATDLLKAQVDALEHPGQKSDAADALNDVLTRLRRILDGEAPPPAPAVQEPDQPKLGEILVQSGCVSPEKLQQALELQQSDPAHPRLGEVLVREQHAEARQIAQALRTQKQSAGEPGGAVRETVKVDAERLDRLVEMIGELVITETMVSQLAVRRESEPEKLTQALALLDKTTRELQEEGMSLRMVPLRSLFQKMAKLVRDLGKKANKPVEFTMAGEETELDKMVFDRIGDPLVHMIRNAVDHGLEPDAETRRRAGKPDAGRIELRAFHRGGSIYIEIADDGRGLDRDAILAKGRERGLVREGETPSDREIYNLIFAPGFSTAKQITDVSGRGVGMDVVRRNIDGLRGQVEIQTERGAGSTFSIRLPLTLAIIDGMVVRVAGERYVIPTLSVVRALRPEAAQVSSVLGCGQALTVQEEIVPLFRLAELFGIAGGRGIDAGIVVLIEEDGRRTGLLVDELLGQQQIVIKSLSAGVRSHEGLAGGAIMPDGQVGLILDVGGLIRLARA